MRTATLVLAILATVFGALGVLLALGFGSLAATIPQGLGGGTGIIRNAMWALGALAVGIAGTVIVGRRHRLGAAMLVAAAVVGMAGTAAFALGTLLYLIAAGLAFFTKPVLAGPAGIVAPVTSMRAEPFMDAPDAAAPLVADPSSSTARVSGSRSGAPRLRRRTTVVALAAALVVAIVIAASIVGQAAEQRPATAVFDALRRGDDAALAALLPSAARSGDAARDADTALRTALGNSSLSFLGYAWLRSLGPSTGTTMSFENLQTTTISKTNDNGIVRVTGVFTPTNPNPLLNAALQIARVGFSVDVPTVRESSSWYLAAAPYQPGSSGTSTAGTDGTERLRVTAGPIVASVTAGGATVTWVTNKPSTSQVIYGPTEQFGSQSALDSNLVTNHSIQLAGLVPSTVYYMIGRSSTSTEAVTSGEVTLTTVAPQARLIPGSYPQSAAPVESTIAGWRVTLRTVIVREDGSIQMDFDVTVGDSNPWAAEASYLRRADGKRLANIQPQGVFHPGSARGSTVKNSLVFPPGLAGYQPYVIKICAADYCYYSDIAGPTLPERPQ